MMMQTMNVARRIGVARAAVAMVVGLLGLTLGGCASSNTALLDCLKTAGVAGELRSAPEAADLFPKLLDVALLSTALPDAISRFVKHGLA